MPFNKPFDATPEFHWNMVNISNQTTNSFIHLVQALLTCSREEISRLSLISANFKRKNSNMNTPQKTQSLSNKSKSCQPVLR